MANSVPHPVPYQGSKRRLAAEILALAPARARVLYEPFAGSLAVTLAFAAHERAARFVAGDALAPLAALWGSIVERPAAVADAYEALWASYRADDPFERVRAAFNRDRDPAKLLYLLARCVKAAVRFNGRGEFNQGVDRRRRGASPARVRAQVTLASALLAGRTTIVADDFASTIATAEPGDLVYLDPPWEGTTVGRDHRYVSGLPRERLLDALADLDARGVPFLLSYDGSSGERRYGAPLPASLALRRVALDGGRSSQATLLGRDARTTESLYVSRALRAQTSKRKPYASG